MPNILQDDLKLSGQLSDLVLKLSSRLFDILDQTAEVPNGTIERGLTEELSIELGLLSTEFNLLALKAPNLVVVDKTTVDGQELESHRLSVVVGKYSIHLYRIDDQLAGPDEEE